MNKNNGLQKLTKLDRRINALMKKERVVEADLNEFSEPEKDIIAQYLTKLINESKGYERDALLYKIEPIIPKGTKNQLWESNHSKITIAISKLIGDYGRMPNKNEIAESSGLSRTTIYKHLREYVNHPLYVDEIRTYKFMADKVLAKVFQTAMKGETKAARLYFEMVGVLGNQSEQTTNYNTQNNFIQINQTKLSQETIKQLSPEQLNRIEKFLQSLSNIN